MNAPPVRFKHCLSDLALDRLIAGEPAGADGAAAQGHLGVCPLCRARFEAISAESQAFAEWAPPLPARRPARPEQPPGAQGARRRWRTVAPWAALAAAALGTVLLQVRAPDRSQPAGEVVLGERTKGGGALGYFVQRAGVIREGRAGDRLFPGDAVQFVYSAPSEGYLAILAVDGLGAATVYYPTGTEVAVAIGRGPRQPLPRSTILDGSLGPETTFAFFCQAPVRLEPLRAALAARPARVEPPAGCTLETLGYEKVAP